MFIAVSVLGGGCPQGSKPRCTVTMHPEDQHPAPMPSVRVGRADCGCCRHGWMQRLGTLLPPTHAPLWPGHQKPELPMPCCWQEVRRIQPFRCSALSLFARGLSLSQHSVNGLCETARWERSILIPYLPLLRSFTC